MGEGYEKLPSTSCTNVLLLMTLNISRYHNNTTHRNERLSNYCDVKHLYCHMPIFYFLYGCLLISKMKNHKPNVLET